ncbi:MAG: DUF2155 domain-containing protein [Nitrospiraceae bacterium]|nr:DUF2155 domain-containing protein [Nitrospiraceae bacterium]
MKKQILVAVCSLSLLFAVGACKKKQEQPMPQTGMPGQQLPAGHPPTGEQPSVVMPKGETTVSVPDSVKGKWKAVVLVVEDKATKKAKEYTVNLNGDLKVPDSKLKIEVGEFLPDFKMEGLKITSMSNEPNNPAVRVKVFEDGKEIFKGWLYEKFPTIHPFEHQKYSLALKGGVKKG